MKTRFGWALASAMLLGGIGSANAADMAVKAPPMAPAPIWTWTGFYIGGNVGGIWNDTRDDVFPTGCFLFNVACGLGPTVNPLRSNSVRLERLRLHRRWSGRLQLAERQVRRRFRSRHQLQRDQRQQLHQPSGCCAAGRELHPLGDRQAQWFGTFRGRAGFTVTPSFLLYATGGLAFGQVKSASAVAFTATTDVYAGSLDETRFGWTVGAGGEWMIAPKWSIKAEYLFVDLGRSSYTQVCITAVCTRFLLRLRATRPICTTGITSRALA